MAKVPKSTKLSGACIQGKPGGCGLQWAMHQTSQPQWMDGWVGASDRQPNLDLAMRLQFRVSMVLRKGNLSCSAMLPSPLRASETNSSTILHSVINIGRDPNQFLSRTTINLGPQDGYHTFPSPAQVGPDARKSSLSLLIWVFRQGDVIIAVMGMTGSGKSSFISQFNTHRPVKVGPTLESCKCIK